MNGRLQGFLSFLDLLAEGQSRQAGIITGRRYEASEGLEPVIKGNAVKFPLTGHQKPHLFRGTRTARVVTRH